MTEIGAAARPIERALDPHVARPAGQHDAEAVARAWVLRLALGAAQPDDTATIPAVWSEVLQQARRERCLPLCWIRGSATIRRAAPPEIATAWRQQALAAAALADLQVNDLAILLDLLREDGIAPIVLKGLPLAVHLYGDLAARPVSDTDIFVSSDLRGLAHQRLLSGGWKHVRGFAPSEGTYRYDHADRVAYLEVHSSVLDDPVLTHAGVLHPTSEQLDVAGVPTFAYWGPSLAVFLSAHLAKHARGPLLWWVDLAAVWRRLSPAEREDARTLAERARLGRVLEWALQGVAAVERAEGDAAAALEAAATLREMHRSRNAFRLARLASSLVGRLRVYLAWAFPPASRRSPRALVRSVLARVRRRVAVARRAISPAAVAPPTLPDYQVTVSGEGLVALVREVVGAGATLWVRARGSSMSPAIPADSEVRVGPLPARPLRAGDVVMAVSPMGAPFIHRVVRVAEGTAVLRGDNVVHDDGAVEAERILALADAIRVDGRQRPIPARRSRLRAFLGRYASVRHRLSRRG